MRRVAAAWLEGNGGEAESALVAVGPARQVAGVTTTQVISLQADVVGTVTPSLPARYGYIGMTCVDEGHRGLGIGGLLLQGALDRLRALPEPPRVVGLHYVADNALAAPFWSSRGFAAALTLLTTAAAGAPDGNAHRAQ